MRELARVVAVSYTHLDVYKRQDQLRWNSLAAVPTEPVSGGQTARVD